MEHVTVKISDQNSFKSYVSGDSHWFTLGYRYTFNEQMYTVDVLDYH